MVFRWIFNALRPPLKRRSSPFLLEALVVHDEGFLARRVRAGRDPFRDKLSLY
jgi:hypothetical protein